MHFHHVVVIRYPQVTLVVIQNWFRPIPGSARHTHRDTHTCLYVIYIYIYKYSILYWYSHAYTLHPCLYIYMIARPYRSILLNITAWSDWRAEERMHVLKNRAIQPLSSNMHIPRKISIYLKIQFLVLCYFLYNINESRSDMDISVVDSLPRSQGKQLKGARQPSETR